MRISELTTIASFWDTAFKEGEPSPLKKEDFQPSQKLNQDILLYGKQAKKALDFGSGVDLLFLEAALEGATFEGLNLDLSPAATKLYQGYIDLSKVTNVRCQKGGLEALSSYPDGSFDLVVISNVIDVLPADEAERILQSVKRLLAPKGVFLLKTNFYINDEMAHKRGMNLSDGKLYVDGVLRAVNRTNESWIAQCEPLRLVDSYPYERIPNGPKDRCFVFMKTSLTEITVESMEKQIKEEILPNMDASLKDLRFEIESAKDIYTNKGLPQLNDPKYSDFFVGAYHVFIYKALIGIRAIYCDCERNHGSNFQNVIRLVKGENSLKEPTKTSFEEWEKEYQILSQSDDFRVMITIVDKRLAHHDLLVIDDFVDIQKLFEFSEKTHSLFIHLARVFSYSVKPYMLRTGCLTNVIESLTKI